MVKMNSMDWRLEKWSMRNMLRLWSSEALRNNNFFLVALLVSQTSTWPYSLLMYLITMVKVKVSSLITRASILETLSSMKLYPYAKEVLSTHQISPMFHRHLHWTLLSCLWTSVAQQMLDFMMGLIPSWSQASMLIILEGKIYKDWLRLLNRHTLFLHILRRQPFAIITSYLRLWNRLVEVLAIRLADYRDVHLFYY